MLARLRKGADPAEPIARKKGARMTATAAFGSNPGGLRMLSYAPERLPANAPLVVVLHGCTQRAEAYAANAGWLTLADRHGFAVLAPEQVPANNPNRCFNWFSPDDTRRGEGEAASIAAMVAHAVGEYGLDRSRVFITGLSAGGAMTSVMLAAYPDVFAGGAIIAGLPYGVANSVQEAMRVMHRADGRSSPELGALVRGAAPVGGRIPRIAIWHGGADAVVNAANADDIASQWAWTHGLSAKPDEMRSLPGRSQAIWRSPTTGDVLIESNLVQGLGHGTPLAAGGADGLGGVAPFMLEAGISSSMEILGFWGLAEAAAANGARPASRADLAPTDAPPEPARAPEPPEHGGLGDQVMTAISSHVPAAVQTVIAKALKSAGLMT
jgi:poly(hydroxyalkanoate) depolymerase family esterase